MRVTFAGAALAASFPPVGLWPLAWIALWPFFTALCDRAAGQRLALGSLVGLLWAGGITIWWLYPAVRSHLEAGPLAAAAVTVAVIWTYGAVYYAALALVYAWLPRPPWLSVPATWVLLEEIRGRALRGAPWALLGHTQHAVLPLAQLAELTGVPGLSFLLVMPAAALAERGPARLRGLAVASGAVAVVLLFGLIRLRTFPIAPAGPSDSAAVRVVGGQNLAPDSLASYLAATAAAAPAPLTVWPEAAVAGYLQDVPAAAARLAAAARARGWLLLGALRHQGHGRARRYFNSALLIDPAGRLRAAYDKRRLVPFAEDSPLPFLPSVPRPFSPGREAVAPLATDDLRLGPLICWEVLFPELGRDYARLAADVLVNLTSDRDLGAGAGQLLAFSRFRAIETRRWLVRASGTGPAYLVDPAGRVWEEAAVRLKPAAAVPMTFYVRHGDVVVWASAAMLGLLVSRQSVRTKRRRGGRTEIRSCPA